MLYSCTHMTTVGVKGLMHLFVLQLSTDCADYWLNQNTYLLIRQITVTTF